MVKDLRVSGISVSVQNNESLTTGIPIFIEGKEIIVAQQPYAYYFAVFEIIKIAFPGLDLSSYLTEFEECIEGRKGTIDDIRVTQKDDFQPLKKSYKGKLLLASFLGALISAFFSWILGWYQPVTQIYTGTLSRSKESTTNQNPSLFSDWNLPFLPDSYVPRIKTIEAIWDQLLKQSNETTSNKQVTTKIVGLTGPGGVGKTFLAMYCIHNPTQPYAFKAWFSAETLDVLKANYFELGEKLQLFLPRMSEMQKIREVKSWIENQGSILLTRIMD